MFKLTMKSERLDLIYKQCTSAQERSRESLLCYQPDGGKEQPPRTRWQLYGVTKGSSMNVQQRDAHQIVDQRTMPIYNIAGP